MFFISMMPPELFEFLENLGNHTWGLFDSEHLGGFYDDHLEKYVSMVPIKEVGMTVLLFFLGIGLMNDMANGKV